MGFPIAAGAALVSGLIGGIAGAKQRKQGKQILKDNPYPTYSIPQEVMQNKNLAQSMAGEGLPSQQYNQAMNNIQRQQTFAIRNLQDRRSALMGLPKILRASNDAGLNLDVANANARRQNQRQLMDVNNQVSRYKDQAWNWNVKNKYEQNYAYGMSLLGKGNQNIMGGIDKGLGGIALGLDYYTNKDNDRNRGRDSEYPS